MKDNFERITNDVKRNTSRMSQLISDLHSHPVSDDLVHVSR